MWEFWLRVNEEDLSNQKEFDVHGEIVTVPEIEATLYQCFHEGAKVKMALDGSEIVGFMLYHKVYNCLLMIRHMYVIPGYEKKNVARMLADSERPTKIFFQTRKNNPPNRLLDVTSFRRIKLHETEDLITWEMEWRK